jgi:hypothetical protein
VPAGGHCSPVDDARRVHAAHHREVADIDKRSWTGPAGWSLVSGVALAVVGWALSLTVGQNVQRWPWILAGAVAGVGTMLIFYDRVRSWLSSFIKINRTPSGGLNITADRPSRGKRKLRNETMQVVSELRAYIKGQPSPVTERIKQVLAEPMNRMPNVEIWNYQDAFEADLDKRSKDELNTMFGGRIPYLVGEYKRLEMLPDHRSREDPEEPNAADILRNFDRLPWAHIAANQLEVLARRL